MRRLGSQLRCESAQPEPERAVAPNSHRENIASHRYAPTRVFSARGGCVAWDRNYGVNLLIPSLSELLRQIAIGKILRLIDMHPRVFFPLGVDASLGIAITV